MKSVETPVDAGEQEGTRTAATEPSEPAIPELTAVGEEALVIAGGGEGAAEEPTSADDTTPALEERA